MSFPLQQILSWKAGGISGPSLFNNYPMAQGGINQLGVQAYQSSMGSLPERGRTWPKADWPQPTHYPVAAITSTTPRRTRSPGGGWHVASGWAAQCWTVQGLAMHCASGWPSGQVPGGRGGAGVWSPPLGSPVRSSTGSDPLRQGGAALREVLGPVEVLGRASRLRWRHNLRPEVRLWRGR